VRPGLTTPRPHFRILAYLPDCVRGLGLATATTSAAFLPQQEHRIRSASSFSVTFQPTRRATASGSISRQAPQSQMTRSSNWPNQSSSFLMWARARAHGADGWRGRPFSAGPSVVMHGLRAGPARRFSCPMSVDKTFLLPVGIDKEFRKIGGP
jgi:hypothetical protein